MASNSSLPPKNLPVINRFITTHTPDGKTTFDSGIPEEIKFDTTPLGGDLTLVYTLGQFPAPLDKDADLKQFKEHLVNHPPFMIPGGGVARYVDYHPKAHVTCGDLWHRTETIDFGVVIEGELEIALDSGERRVMKRGDVCVQRGTNHCWRNVSETEYARALYVALCAEPPVINGEKMGESLGKVAH